MQFPPELYQHIWKPEPQSKGPMHSCMAAGAQDDQPFRIVNARTSMMHNHVVPAAASATALFVTAEDRFPMSSEESLRTVRARITDPAQLTDFDRSPEATAKQRILEAPR
jgi:hypothetical protein